MYGSGNVSTTQHSTQITPNTSNIYQVSKNNNIHQSTWGTFKAAFLFLNITYVDDPSSVVSLPAFHLNSVKVQAFSSAPYPEPDILVILLVVMTIPTPHPAVGLMFARTLEWSDANQVYSLSGTPGCGRTLTQKHLMIF